MTRIAFVGGRFALKTAKMKADEEHLLADSASHHGSFSASLALTRAQQKRKGCKATVFLVSGIAVVSLLVVLFFFTGCLNPLSNDGKSSPPPRGKSRAFVEIVEHFEVSGWTKRAEEISGKINPSAVQGSPNETVAASCGAAESDRFDCWPELISATQEKCAERGCCWKPSLKNGVPYCFYPDNFVSYAVKSSPLSSNSGMTVTLERKAASPYPNDVLELQVDVIYETETTVRFRVRSVLHSVVKSIDNATESSVVQASTGPIPECSLG